MRPVGYMDTKLLDMHGFAQARQELGGGFVRLLGYFREDGEQSVGAIERAMRNHDAVALILPAHRLKGESRQFGADRLGDMAEKIEMVARRCVEYREDPDELLETVVALRNCFVDTMDELERNTNPLMQRRPRAPDTL